MRWLAPHHRSTHKPIKGKRVTGLMPGTAVRNNIYRRGDEVTWQCIPPNGDCPQAQCPVPWWGSGARISADTVAMPCPRSMSHEYILDPQQLQRGAWRGCLALRSCDRQRLSLSQPSGGDRGSSPQGLRYQASHYVRWLAPHHRSTHKPQKVSEWLAWCQTLLCGTIYIGEVTKSPDSNIEDYK